MQTDRERRFGLLQIIVSLLMQMFLLHLRSVLCGLVESNDRTCTGFPTPAAVQLPHLDTEERG